LLLHTQHFEHTFQAPLRINFNALIPPGISANTLNAKDIIYLYIIYTCKIAKNKVNILSFSITEKYKVRNKVTK